MDKRPVRWIHQADDSVIHGAGKISRQVSQFVLVAEGRNPRRGYWRLGSFGKTSSRRRRLGNEDPDKVVMLFAGVAAGINAVNLQPLIRGERRNELALARVSIKPPAVIAALHLLPIEKAVRQWHAAVGAGVIQGKRAA